MQENRFYVYVHTCKNSGEVKYIGKGTDGRYKHKSNRTKVHRDMWQSLDKKILIDNLNEDVASSIEYKLITDALATGKNLLNIVKSKTDVRKIDYTELSTVFEYSEDSPSGLITKIDRRGSVKAGEPVGFICSSKKTGGYWKVKYKGQNLLVHRIVYSIVHKVELKKELVIDHIDSDRTNNKINNLQQVTRSKNNSKSSKSKRNTSGATGVSWHERWKKWYAYWNVDRKLQTKGFPVRKLYPNIDFNTAKELAFKDAVEYRNKMVELYYVQSVGTGEVP